jgi:glutathione S-transferase
MIYPILYSFRRCPYAMRARLALEAGGIEVELREIVLRNKAPELLVASEKATVPVMVLDDGTVLEESLDVMRWALDTSDAGKTLTPDRGNMRDAIALIERMDAEFKPHLDAYKYLHHSDRTAAFEARDRAIGFLNEMDNMLAGKPYLYGLKRSIADVGTAPFVRQFAHVDRDWFYSQGWKNLKPWLKVFLESDAFLRIMKKYPEWMAGDVVTLFPPEVL